MANYKLELPFDKKHWKDADEKMFLACFTILGDFVEKELGKKSLDFGEFGKSTMYKGYRLHSAGAGGTCERKAINLWLWYSKELPQLIKDVNEDMRNTMLKDDTQTLGFRHNPDYIQKYEYGHIDLVKDNKFKQLMKIRKGLWI